ncbi:uncharacterized protein LOC134273907 [Saccostrea cucullata]|uniref:uncharacterized protein LOC134273907 n=1 Tax=Saccostrea cuccullata TaxID=36930 RepID=UPI002ED60E72
MRAQRLKMQREDIMNDYPASRYCSHSSSNGDDGCSDENAFPCNTSSWTSDFVDKLGIRKVLTNPFELVRTEWSLCQMSSAELTRIDELAKMCSFMPRADCYSLEEIPYEETKCYKQWVKEWFPTITVKEFKLFSRNYEEFAYFLFDTMQQIHQRQLPHEVAYQVLFEKILNLFEFKVK